MSIDNSLIKNSDLRFKHLLFDWNFQKLKCYDNGKNSATENLKHYKMLDPLGQAGQSGRAAERQSGSALAG